MLVISLELPDELPHLRTRERHGIGREVTVGMVDVDVVPDDYAKT